MLSHDPVDTTWENIPLTEDLGAARGTARSWDRFPVAHCPAKYSTPDPGLRHIRGRIVDRRFWPGKRATCRPHTVQSETR